MTIKRTKIERIVIECPMQDAAKAIQYRIDHGYKMSGWAGPALSKKCNGPMLDESRYHCEGEKVLSELRGFRTHTVVIDDAMFIQPKEIQP